MTAPEVDVIVPVLDGGEALTACLVALSSQTLHPSSVIVVDNGSSDGSAARARELGATVVTEVRRSSYAARNRGIRASDAPVVAFTDVDCRPSPNWLEAAVRALEAGELSMVAGRITQVGVSSLASRYDARIQMDQRAYVERLQSAATANLVVRREVFDAVGLFDPRLRSGGDVEFTRRAVAAGYALGYEDSAEVLHATRTTLRGVTRKAWRVGTGHGELHGRHPELDRWGFSVKRLGPSRKALALWASDPLLVVVDTWVSWVGLVARLLARASRGRGRAG